MNKIVTVGRGPVAAAVLAVLIGACGLGSQESSPEPAATPEPAAEPASDPTPEPTGEGLETGPFVLSDGAAGAPITVMIPADAWYGVAGQGLLIKNDNGDPPDGAGLIGPFHPELWVPEDPCQWQSTMPDRPATTVDEVMVALQSQRSRHASGPVSIAVDGYSGKSITLHVPDDLAFSDGFPACDLEMFCTLGAGNPADPCARSAQGPGQIEDVWVLDVGGVVMVVVGMYFPETSDETVDEVRAILGSMTVGD